MTAVSPEVDPSTGDIILKIAEPGVYPDIPNDAYHADPVAGGSLSSSGARALLGPSCPAKYDWTRRHGQDHRAHWDIGHAAHKLVLGTGPDLVVVDAKDWRTNAAKQARDAAYADGAVPLLVADHHKVTAMADALRAHPVASMLFDPERGRPEQTLVWRDERTGVWCRARLDWLPEALPGQRLIVPDYKTTFSADPDNLSKAVAQHGYDVQDWWYQAGCKALGVADADTAFVFVCQEKDPPYLVTIVELDHVSYWQADGVREPSGILSTPLVVLGTYWCRCGTPDDLHSKEVHHPKLWQQLEAQGVSFEWYDEWVIDHDHDKAYRTQPDSYLWQPSHVMTEDGALLTPDDDVETWIDWATEDGASRCLLSNVTDESDVLGAGFERHNGQFESGWHPGQDDDPKVIADAIREQHGDVDIVFMLDSTGQFDIAFSAYYRIG